MTQVRQGRPNFFDGGSLADAKQSAADGSLFTAFGLLRVASPHSIFDSKQLFDALPLLWDDVGTGAGSGSAHSSDTASSTLSVSNTTTGTRTRQTFERFNYQPGKSQVAVMTGILGSGASGITTQIGLCDDDNGFAFENIDGAVNVNRRTSTSGSAVNNRTAQANWNLDPMDGSGPSGVTLDFDMAQIFFVDFQWLGVGRVRFGFDIDGVLIYCHEDLNANIMATVHVSTPNLPFRYKIANDGTGPAATMVHLCTAIYSEGGRQELGILQYESTLSNRSSSTAHINANVADTAYAIIGIRLKSTHFGSTVNLESASLLAETNTSFEWLVLFNPTIAGTFAYGDKANSSVQTAIGSAANPSTNTVTALGTVIGGGLVHSSGAGGSRGGSIDPKLDNALRLGATIADVADTIVLAARPLAVDADIHGSLEWQEVT